jgi:hypothetical protein
VQRPDVVSMEAAQMGVKAGGADFVRFSALIQVVGLTGALLQTRGWRRGQSWEESETSDRERVQRGDIERG